MEQLQENPRTEISKTNFGTSLTLSEDNHISIYKGQLVSKELFAEQTAKIARAFPKLQPGWFSVLKERIKDKGFSSKRLIDAVNHLIDTCDYPEPTIAGILSYDRKIKLYSNIELNELANRQGNSIRKEFDLVEIEGIKLWAHKQHIKKYNLPVVEGKKFVQKTTVI